MSAIETDDKDWTWVLDRTCDECAFDAPRLDLDRLPNAIRDNATVWQVVLQHPDAAVRPSPHIWSPLEYACHVRDVNRLFAERVRKMLDEDSPEFPDWDQDAAAVEHDYGSQDPAVVAGEVVGSAEAVAAVYETVTGDQWQRPGRRSNGSEFTVESIGRYHLHDLVHHTSDISYLTKRITVESYDVDAVAFAESAPPMDSNTRAATARLVAAVGKGARVLEIGSGPGRDALALEELGVSVRRTDIARGFVRRLREAGFEADVLDPLSDNLADPSTGQPYDAVWASGSLLHVRREDLRQALAKLAHVTRPGGYFYLAVKEGDGARFSTHGRVLGPRHFTFWREEGLREVLEAAGWVVDAVDHVTSDRGEAWLDVDAHRADSARAS